jgi:AcrR family transcriptional regulator
VPPRARRRIVDVRSAAVDSATELIAQHGYGAISVQDIAQRVGVTKQALLYHFKSKDALMLAVIDALLERANARLTRLLGELPADEEQRVEAILEHVNMYLEEEPHAAAVFLRLLLDGQGGAADRIRDGARPWFKFLEDAIRRGQSEGRLRADMAPEHAVLQVGMLVITNFALLPIGHWMRKPPAGWKRERLRELVKTIGFILFPDRG